MMTPGALLGIYSDESSVESAVYIFAEILLLKFQAVMLDFLLCADAAICCHTHRSGEVDHRLRGDDFYLHCLASFFLYRYHKHEEKKSAILIKNYILRKYR